LTFKLYKRSINIGLLSASKATEFIELGGDTSVSIAVFDAVDSLNSTGLMRQAGTQSSCAPKFRAWSFRLTIKADFAGAVDKGQRLKEHISERTTIDRPFSALCSAK
jgi:hypothetical protein